MPGRVSKERRRDEKRKVRSTWVFLGLCSTTRILVFIQSDWKGLVAGRF